MAYGKASVAVIGPAGKAGSSERVWKTRLLKSPQDWKPEIGGFSQHRTTRVSPVAFSSAPILAPVSFHSVAGGGIPAPEFCWAGSPTRSAPRHRPSGRRE